MLGCLSLLCLSRPAALAVEAPEVDGRATWPGDLTHLGLLVLATGLALVLAFLRVEPSWLSRRDT